MSSQPVDPSDSLLLRPSRSLRRFWTLFAFIYLTWPVCGAIGFAAEGLTDFRTWFFFILSVLIACVGFLGSLHERRWAIFEEVRLFTDRWIHRTPSGPIEIAFRDIELVKWSHIYARTVRITTAHAVDRIDLNNFDLPQRLELVRRLRNLVPQNLQAGWPLFCLIVANSLRDRVENWPPANGLFVTRRRWDCLFLGLFLIVLMLFGTLAITLSHPRLWYGPVVVLLMWIPWRFTTPKEGEWFAKSKVEANRDDFAAVVFGLLFLLLLIAVFAANAAIHAWYPSKSGAAVWPHYVFCGFVLTASVLALKRSMVAQSKRNQLKAAEAAAEWDAGEQRTKAIQDAGWQ